MAYSVSFQIRPSIQMKQIFHCASTSQVFTSENASPSRQATSSSIYLTRKPCFRFTNCQPRAALTFHTALSARASRVLGKYAFSASRHPDPKTLTPKLRSIQISFSQSLAVFQGLAKRTLLPPNTGASADAAHPNLFFSAHELSAQRKAGAQLVF